MEVKIKQQGLTTKVMQQFGVEKFFRDTDELKFSMSFSNDGDLLATCDHQYLILYGCGSLKKLCQVRMRRYHSELLCFTQQNDRLLHTSTKEDFAVRLLDLNNREHVRLFNAHKKRVRALCFRPAHQNQFLTAGWDNRVYLWDQRSSTYMHRLDYLQSPLATFDPNGMVFAISSTTECIELYDVRMLSSKPLQQFCFLLKKDSKWTQLQFAPDGKTILVSTDYIGCFSVSALNGKFHQEFSGYPNKYCLPIQCCYTPDSQFILAGADNGRIHVWNAESGQTVAVLHSNNTEPVRCVQFNPKQTMFVSSDSMTRFWLSKTNDHHKQEVEEKPKLESVVHKIIPTVDLTALDNDKELAVNQDEIVEVVDEEDDDDEINSKHFCPMPMPNIPSVPLRLKRRLGRPQWTQNQDDSLEEGELHEDV